MSERNEIVYLIKAGNFYKIGKSNIKSLKNRMGDIQCANPNKVEIVKLIYVYDSTTTEGTMHDLYRAQRRRGEWFIFSDSEIQRVLVSMDKLEASSIPLRADTFIEERDVDYLWEKAIARLIEVCEENQYNQNWVFHRLERLKPSEIAWEKYAEWRGYKPGWASIQFSKQDEVQVPPTTKKMLIGLGSTRVDRLRKQERRELRARERKFIRDAVNLDDRQDSNDDSEPKPRMMLKKNNSPE
jgi:hypothetical protein